MPECKTCSRCGEAKPLDQFHVNARARDGRHPYCKVCRQAYFHANKARYNAGQRALRAQWTPAQKARRAAYYRGYYARNRDVLREKARLRREAERAARLPWYSTAPVL